MITNKQTRYVLFAAVAILSLATGFLYSNLNPQSGLPSIPNDFEATVFPEARDLVPFKLIDHNGKDFSPENLKQKWSMMFFGFTHCPDVCPTTLKILQEFWNELPKDVQARTQVIFMTVDPNRDTAPIIKEYVQYFEPSFIGLTGNLGQITAFTRSLGILYEYVSKGKDKNNYGVNHSAHIVLIDPQARLRAVFPAPHDPDEMRRNYLKIVDFFKG